MADEEIVVAIDPETPVTEGADKQVEQPRGPDGKFVAKTGDDAVGDLAAQYKELKAKDDALEAELAAERRRREQATQDAQRAREEAAQAKTQTLDSQLDTVTTGIAAAQAEASSAEQAYVTAQEAGNWAEAAKAQRRMASAEAKIVRLDEAKSDIEARKAEAPKAREARTETPQTATDPLETYLQGRTEPTAKWLREHRDWVLDPKKNQKLTAAHWNAVADGLTADTEAYFEHVESFIGLRKSDAGSGNGHDKPTPQTTKRKSSAPVAPVQASGGGTNGGGQEVRLTASEARAAQDGTLQWNYDDPSPQKKFRKGDPIGIQEFARRKLALTQQGAYDRSYTES